jgi:hypothetical protein
MLADEAPGNRAGGVLLDAVLLHNISITQVSVRVDKKSRKQDSRVVRTTIPAALPVQAE